ncbi:MAG: hypothetical protein HQK63_17090 [Desulfamplus sp.]|nr:hypothetical protein [Desulfamplus sp.]
MELVINIPTNQFEKLKEIASQIGILPEHLAKLAISDLIRNKSLVQSGGEDYEF